MSGPKKQFPKKTNVLLLWRCGEERSYLENVDVTVLEDGVVQIRNPAKKETLTTHISNIVIISEEES